jgi:hypothetical protein
MVSRLVLAVLLLLAPAAFAAEDPLARLAGRWSGKVTERTGPLHEGGETVEVVLEPSGGGFAFRLAVGGREVIRTSLVRGKRPGVYEPAGGGIAALLMSRKPSNPLQGDRLVWARDDAAGLVLYTLDLKVGLLQLERLALRPTSGGVELVASRRTHGSPELRLTAALTRRS